MSFLVIIVLAVLQGACEFLPVSSSGHLVVFYNFFGIYENTILLSIMLHVATLLSVVVIYKNDIFSLIKKPFCKTNKLLLSATVPTIIIVLLLESFIEKSFSGTYVIYSFLFTALLLFVAEQINKARTKKQLGGNCSTKNNDLLTKSSIYEFDINYKQAIIIGLAQGVAALPGISRSGATIATGLMVGVKKNQVANFSFLLSIPIILASLGYELLKLNSQTAILAFNVWELLVGFVVAFLVGLFCLKVMIAFVKKQKLYIFYIYLVLLVLFLLLNKYVFLLF